MADKVVVTNLRGDLEGVGVLILGDVQSDNIRVNPIPTQIAVSTSVATLIVPANSRRRSVRLTNLTGSQVCHLDIDNSVSATTSRAILTAAIGNTITFYTKDAIWGLSITGAQTVLVWEEVTVDVQGR